MLQAVFPTFRLTENPAVQLLFLLLQESVFFFQVGDTLRNKAEGYCWLQGRAPAGINFTLQETGGFGDSLSLLFKRSVPLCCATCPLYASSWSTATTETNFPFPECISPLNQCFQQNLIKYWTAGLGDHDLQEWSFCKWSGHQTRGLFLHLNGLHHCLQVTAPSHSCWGNKSADCSQRCSTSGAEMDTVNVSWVNRSGFFNFIVPNPFSMMSHFSASHNYRTSGTARSDTNQGPWQHNSSIFSNYQQQQLPCKK